MLDINSPDMHVLAIRLYLSLIPNKHFELTHMRVSGDLKRFAFYFAVGYLCILSN